LLDQSGPSLLSAELNPLAEEEKISFSLIAGGDLMFDRHIRTKAVAAGSYTHVFAPELTDFLNSADYVLANLEGPITTEKSISQFSLPGGPGNYTFTFDPEILPVLTANNLTLLNLGNNHILNFGQSGLSSTLDYLTQVGLNFFGDTGSDLLNPRYLLLPIANQQLAIINYNQFVSNAKTKAMSDLAKVKELGVSLIILYTHWGNEYAPIANQAIVDLAHEFIDAGVDLIIGSHPHVVQNSEIYQGKSIYYSLGNFVFDQYFSTATKAGLLLKIDFSFNEDEQAWNYQISKQPIVMTADGKTSLDLIESSDVQIED